YATGQTRVKESIVRRAAREVLGPRRSRRWVAATAAAVLLVLAGGTIGLVATGGLRSLGAWALARTEKTAPPPEAQPPVVAPPRRPAAGRRGAARAGAAPAGVPGRPLADRRSGECLREPLCALGSRRSRHERRPRMRDRARGGPQVSHPRGHLDGAPSSQLA